MMNKEIKNIDSRVLKTELYDIHEDLIGVKYLEDDPEVILQLTPDSTEDPKEMVKEEFESDSLTYKILHELEKRRIEELNK